MTFFASTDKSMTFEALTVKKIALDIVFE